jgi:PAS domain S-box-containing protein
MEGVANEIIKILEGTGDGAFIVDSKLRIKSWNKSAKNILGFNHKDAEGQLCYQILNGLDDEGALFCKAYCKILKMVQKSKPISSYDLSVQTKNGDRRWLNISILSLNNSQNGNKVIMHIFRDISQKKDNEDFFRHFMETASQYDNFPSNNETDPDPPELIEELTNRQKEVLNLLARGLGTREIAENLTISTNTVRNHIQNILQKLRVNSRLEAVTLAYEKGLLD